MYWALAASEDGGIPSGGGHPLGTQHGINDDEMFRADQGGHLPSRHRYFNADRRPQGYDEESRRQRANDEFLSGPLHRAYLGDAECTCALQQGHDWPAHATPA